MSISQDISFLFDTTRGGGVSATFTTKSGSFSVNGILNKSYEQYGEIHGPAYEFVMETDNVSDIAKGSTCSVAVDGSTKTLKVDHLEHDGTGITFVVMA